jgi:hypothetical protein
MDSVFVAVQHRRCGTRRRTDAEPPAVTRTSMARDVTRPNAGPARSLLALAAGAVAAGALALGAVAIGQMVIGRLAIGKARFKSLEVDELTVRKLRVIERDDARS